MCRDARMAPAGLGVKRDDVLGACSVRSTGGSNAQIENPHHLRHFSGNARTENDSPERRTARRTWLEPRGANGCRKFLRILVGGRQIRAGFRLARSHLVADGAAIFAGGILKQRAPGGYIGGHGGPPDGKRPRGADAAGGGGRRGR